MMDGVLERLGTLPAPAIDSNGTEAKAETETSPEQINAKDTRKLAFFTDRPPLRMAATRSLLSIDNRPLLMIIRRQERTKVGMAAGLRSD